MVDYKHIGKRVELRWWWFRFDTSRKFAGIGEALKVLLVFAVGVLIFFGLVMVTLDSCVVA